MQYRLTVLACKSAQQAASRVTHYALQSYALGRHGHCTMLACTVLSRQSLGSLSTSWSYMHIRSIVTPQSLPPNCARNCFAGKLICKRPVHTAYAHDAMWSDHLVLCCRLEPHSSSEPTDLAIATGVQLPLKGPPGPTADAVMSAPLSPNTGMLSRQGHNLGTVHQASHTRSHKPGIIHQDSELKKPACFTLAEVVSSVACVKP